MILHNIKRISMVCLELRKSDSGSQRDYVNINEIKILNPTVHRIPIDKMLKAVQASTIIWKVTCFH